MNILNMVVEIILVNCTGTQIANDIIFHTLPKMDIYNRFKKKASAVWFEKLYFEKKMNNKNFTSVYICSFRNHKYQIRRWDFLFWDLQNLRHHFHRYLLHFRRSFYSFMKLINNRNNNHTFFIGSAKGSKSIALSW